MVACERVCEMANGSRKRRSLIIALIAGLVLALGLVPALAFASEGAAGQGTGMTPQATYEVRVHSGKADTTKAIGENISVNPGETVTITAYDPEAGKGFVEWTGTTEDVNLLEKKDSFTTTFTMPSHKVEFTANCAEILITKNKESYVYTGDAIVPDNDDIDVKFKGVDLVVGKKDYKIEAENNVNVGTKAQATVTLINSRIGSTSYKFEITPANMNNVDVSVAKQEYNGTALKPKPTITFNGKAVSEDDYTLEYSNNVHVGTTATVTVKGQNNFTNTTSATFEITPRKLTVTADSAEREYDGKALTASFSSDGLAEGDSISSATVEGSQTDVGSSASTVKDAKIVNADGEDVTDCYDITYKPGTLTVTPAKATITVNSASKVQGAADPVFTGTVEGLVAAGDLGEITYKRTNTDEAPGTYEGVITAEYTANPNYDVTVTNGNFTITEKGSYEVVSGSGGVFVKGSSEALNFTFKRAADDEKTFGLFKGVEVDGKAVPEKDTSGKSNWTAKKGSLVLSLQSSYLGTLGAGDHTVRAVFDDGSAETTFKVAEVSEHTVTFDVNGHGKAPAAQSVEDGKVATKPADPVADGWTFGGWYTDKACTKAYNFSTPVTSDMTLYAKWTQKAAASSASAKGTTPKTGDPSGPVLPLVLVLGAAGVLCLALSRRRA